VIPACAIVNEPDHLISKLAVLQNAIGHHAPKIAGAGNEDALQPDAGAPSPLEEFAHRFARAVRKQNVQHQEKRPHDL
jgi:hypothetical protein